ncbi:MAG: hypothetical protein EA394_09610 [Bacteroidia bacterium]|nr:MAG: hypothetical protein EA394_09610 [Bacteroidia bacterium]
MTLAIGEPRMGFNIHPWRNKSSAPPKNRKTAGNTDIYTFAHPSVSICENICVYLWISTIWYAF